MFLWDFAYRHGLMLRTLDEVVESINCNLTKTQFF